MPLTDEQINTLSTELNSTLSFLDLESMVARSTGDRLYDEFVGPGMPKRPTIVKLLEALEQTGITEQFLGLVYRERPLRDDVRAAIAGLFPKVPPQAAWQEPSFSVQKAGAPAEGFKPGMGPGLEKNIRPRLQMLQISVWPARLEQITRQVCLVESAAGGIGTGFLVGASSVLTNWHVVQKAAENGLVGGLGCRFDYRVRADGSIDKGVRVNLGAGGIVDSSPYGPGEAANRPDDPAPKPDELDYALLDLAEPVGTARGIIALAPDAPAVEPDDPLTIVQHPNGDVMKFALDTQSIIGMAPSGLRLRYRTNTEPGSSGSPCFTFDWRLLALHHMGDPASDLPPTFNQGVPIGLIRDAITARGHGARLSA